jgi:hypothetical protein
MAFVVDWRSWIHIVARTPETFRFIVVFFDNPEQIHRRGDLPQAKSQSAFIHIIQRFVFASYLTIRHSMI